MSERVNTPVIAAGLAFGPSVRDAPIFHRVGPEVSSEKDPVVSFAPLIELGVLFFRGGFLRLRFIASGKSEQGSKCEKFKAESAGNVFDHGEG